MELSQVFNASRDLQVIIDLDKNILRINDSFLKFLNITREHALLQKCKHILKKDPCSQDSCPFDRVIKNGEVVELEVIKKNHKGIRVPMFLTATPFKDFDGKVIGIIESFKDISSLRESEIRLQDVLTGTIHSMAEAVETRDPYTSGHQQRVAQIAVQIAEKMEFSRETIDAIKTAAVLHDIGKIYVPSEFLTKPGKLSDIEFAIIKTHAEKGYDILKTIPFQSPIATIIRQHHERMDGSGYPDGLNGVSILREARVISVADVAEAMSSFRPYRQSLGMNAAMAEIKKFRGIKYDSDAADAFFDIVDNIKS
ncbi:MAG: HD domain-containing protein [Desulfobacterales bacterium]|nr:HD domain-containing protein [Desulfobacterales bacterium]